MQEINRPAPGHEPLSKNLDKLPVPDLAPAVVEEAKQMAASVVGPPIEASVSILYYRERVIPEHERHRYTDQAPQADE